MNSTPNAKDVLKAQTDEQLERAREGLASVREGIARVTEKLSNMERADAGTPSVRAGDHAGNSSVAQEPPPQQPSQPPRVKSAVSGSVNLLPIGLLLAACLVVAALVSQFSLIAARWMPQRVATSSSQPANPPSSAQPDPSLKLLTAAAAPAQTAPLAPTGPQDAAPAAAGVSELMQLQQATARDVAGLKQEIEQLKVKQDQIITGNSKAIEQLKAKLDDMTRLLAKVSEQSALPKTSPPSASPPSAAPPPSHQARMRLRPPPRRQYRPRWQYDDDEW
jgi:hypothetical protein